MVQRHLSELKDSNRNSILKMLDIGAGGLIIPAGTFS